MKRYNKIIIFILIVFISIGFAFLTSNQTLLGISIFRENSWDIYFDITNENTYKTNIISAASVSNKTTLNFSINLNQPASTYTLSSKIINNGTIDAMIESISINNTMDANESKAINLKVAYSDGAPLQNNDLLKANSYEPIVITVYYDNDISNSDLLINSGTLDFEVTINYVQADEDAEERAYQYNIKYNLDGGTISNNPIIYNSREEITLPSPTKEGYTFTGWTGGKNLFYSKHAVFTGKGNNGITTTRDLDGTLHFEGTLTNTAWFNMADNRGYIEPGKYVFSIKDAKDYGVCIKGNLSDENVSIKEYRVLPGEKFIKFNISYRFNYYHYINFFRTNVGYINDSLNIQIEEGEELTPYENYIATPTQNIVIPKGSKGNRTYKANWIAN